LAIADWRVKVGALAVLGAAGAFVLLALPSAPRLLDTSGWADLAARTVPGAYHIHSIRSDGHGDRTQIAAAAARAGLKFIILTDHGDGTRPPDAPAYIDGILVLDGVEISTDNGHYAAIGMPRAPYPLGGSGEAVVEDVRRLGGFGIAAHPGSPKLALRWTSPAQPDGIEWLNLDSEWRDESRSTLVRAGLAYFLRPGPALATLLDRPETLERWNALVKKAPTVALAAVDAHGGVGRRAEDTSRSLSGTIGIPSYEASFRTVSNRVILDSPLSGDAAADARAVYAAIRKGSVFTSVDALAGPALVDFAFESGFNRKGMGSVLAEDADGTLIVRAVRPDGGELAIVHDGRVVATTHGTELRHVLTGARGAYHVEIVAVSTTGMPPVPWVVTNPIYFGAKGPAVARAELSARFGEASPKPLRGEGGAEGARGAEGAIAPFPWRIEKDPSSSAVLRTTDRDATLEYKLGEGERANQFVALATDLHEQSFSAIDLSVSGDHPQRVSVQLRTADGRRWGRSYYIDPGGSALRVRVGDLAPVRPAATEPHVRSNEATSLLLVVDLTNANPGRSGSLRVRSSAFVQ